MASTVENPHAPPPFRPGQVVRRLLAGSGLTTSRPLYTLDEGGPDVVYLVPLLDGEDEWVLSSVCRLFNMTAEFHHDGSRARMVRPYT